MATYTFHFPAAASGLAVTVKDVEGATITTDTLDTSSGDPIEYTLDHAYDGFYQASAVDGDNVYYSVAEGVPAPASSGGVGASGFDETGEGAPTTDPTTVDPGYTYLDTAVGALYMVVQNPEGPINEWNLFGEIDGLNDAQGVVLGNGIALLGKSFAGAQVILSDVDAYNDSGNGVKWVGTGTDGEQYLLVRVGPVGEHVNALTIYSDGTSEFAMDAYFDAAVNATTAVSTKASAAPADADIQSGQVFMFFDSTNGSAKVKFKGKSANGTVVAGEVALS